MSLCKTRNLDEDEPPKGPINDIIKMKDEANENIQKSNKEKKKKVSIPKDSIYKEDENQIKKEKEKEKVEIINTDIPIENTNEENNKTNPNDSTNELIKENEDNNINNENQKKENKLYIYARCWERQLYWKELTETLYPDQKFLSQVIEQDVFVSSLLLKSNSKSSNNERIVLTFLAESSITLPVIVSKKENTNPNVRKTSAKDKKGKKAKKTPVEEKKEENEGVDERCFKRKMIIGNCKLDDNKLEKNGNYEVIMDKDCPYFTCDNPKGSVNSGQELVITFGYKKPERDPLIKDIECLKGVGMWVESTNEIKINGGYIEGNTQDNVSVFVILRAYVEQI